MYVLGRNTLWQPVTPHRHDQTKPVLTFRIKDHSMGEVVVPKYFWLSIIYFLHTHRCWTPYYYLLQFVNTNAYFVRYLGLEVGWVIVNLMPMHIYVLQKLVNEPSIHARRVQEGMCRKNYSMSYARIMHVYNLLSIDTLIRMLKIFGTHSYECQNIFDMLVWMSEYSLM